MSAGISLGCLSTTPGPENTDVLFVNYAIILEDVASILNHSYFFPWEIV